MTGPANSPRYRVKPRREIAGSIVVPGDKSVSHRSLMLGGIAEGKTTVSGFLASEDCLATLKALEAMGVKIERPQPTELTVHGVGLRGLTAPAHTLDMGNAGTAMRLMMGLLAGQNFNATLIGDGSLMKRPMERAAGPLRTMGADIRTAEGGRPPVHIHGGKKLHGIDFKMPVASAQVKSAVLLAGLYADGETRVTEPAPTRDHTERMFKGFGVDITREGAVATLAAGPKKLLATHIDVPADFSSAAFFMVAGCLAARHGLTLRGVGINETRTGLLDILKLMGADITVRPHAKPGPEPLADLDIQAKTLKGIEVPLNLVPLAIDEFPVFFIAAACAEGDSILRGAEELRVKESDRLAAMSAGLTTLGVQHELLPDGMKIRGNPAGFAQGGVIDSRGDHRIAMSFAVASLAAAEPIEILDVANVATSFPGFEKLAREVGIDLEVIA